MSWLYSQELVAEYLGENFSDGEQYALSNGSHTQQAYCAPDKMTDFSRLSRFGMTFKPLTESHGEELLTLYLAGFHAKTSPQQEKELELMESDLECGEKWQGSFTKYDQDMRSWKTHQCSLLGDLDEFSETWPTWGLMRDGECWEQQTLEQTIRGTGYGLSPNGVDSFHTPNTIGLDGGSNSRKALKKKMEKWPTPLTQDSYERSAWKIIAQANEGGKARMTLTRKVKYLEKMLTPVARMWKDNGQSPSELNRNSETLATKAGGSLNPTWVEWLMGWPLGFTDLKPLETDKFHCVQQQHGES
jgi:hypothetical protein